MRSFVGSLQNRRTGSVVVSIILYSVLIFTLFSHNIHRHNCKVLSEDTLITSQSGIRNDIGMHRDCEGGNYKCHIKEHQYYTMS